MNFPDCYYCSTVIPTGRNVCHNSPDILLKIVYHTQKCLVDMATGIHTLPARINSVVGNPSSDREIVTIYTNGTAYRIRVDTGVRHTLISEDDWKVVYNGKVQLQPCHIRLSPYGSTAGL